MEKYIGSRQLLKFLNIVVWVIFVGLSIEAGGLIVNFVISIYKPEFVQNLYNKLDLTEVYQQSRWEFYQIYSLFITIALLKAYLFYIMIKLIDLLDLSSPFNESVASKISEISQYTFAIGIISYITRLSAERIGIDSDTTSQLSKYWSDDQSFVLMSAVVYIIAVIFKRGIEIQSENDLTV